MLCPELIACGDEIPSMEAKSLQDVKEGLRQHLTIRR